MTTANEKSGTRQRKVKVEVGSPARTTTANEKSRSKTGQSKVKVERNSHNA